MSSNFLQYMVGKTAVMNTFWPTYASAVIAILRLDDFFGFNTHCHIQPSLSTIFIDKGFRYMLSLEE